ncbi:hypothetical protein BV22DRAFT_86841 [Leucogyrophana mollusca]|uniref:Uncharacterized protein n=1 Tax=Leucogyrophana mollusca TaxID=85980 RepID=A0ACB8BXE4_9AGAM|nr:hypothetical protein BV22DRAFT_86841 [Leucogyrophana mollusca]
MSVAKQALAARLPISLMAQDEGGLSQEAAGQSKFAVTWPAEPPPAVQALLAERPLALSSSEGESDLSGGEAVSSGERFSQAEQSDSFEVSPSHRFKAQQQLLAHQPEESLNIPRLSRAFSMPLPSQLEHLRNPRRNSGSPETPPVPVDDGSVCVPRFHELSLELADSVQMVVQTLLQVSPAQILDPAKEQFSACSLSVPTSCMSAVFTTMKNLNYISANMPELCGDSPAMPIPVAEDTSRPSTQTTSVLATSDFDIGEMLQGVGDALSGCAAQAGVDLVLYHGDVGMKHVAVRGVECGISNALSHVVRQVIHTARRGDSIDIGLFITSSSAFDPAGSLPIENADVISEDPSSPSSDDALHCTFEITHHLPPSEANADTPTTSDPPSVDRPKLSFDSPFLSRLLSRAGASLVPNIQPRVRSAARACEVRIRLERGSPSVISARTTSLPEDAPALLSGARIATEPALEDLVQFAEKLRGKKVTLYASARSSFAHHLTSYLTAWGLDVSHVSAEPESEGNNPATERLAPPVSGERRSSGGHSPRLRPYGAAEGFPPPEQAAEVNGSGRPSSTSAPSFVFIDDDVSVLREHLRKYRLEQPSQFTLSRKRPSLAAHHRPKSSPQVARAMGLGASSSPHGPAVVVVHFTSLTNYKVVKDIIQCDLAAHASAPHIPPEVMIIPKPAGPRRFLTALHTAVTKPIVDPFFTPIATSPISPGLHGSPFFSVTQPSPKSPSSRPSHSSRSNSDRSIKSPREPVGEPHSLPPPSPLGMSDNIEYFAESSVKLGTSPSSGLVIQSPDGQPAGIFFHPRAKNVKSVPTPAGIITEREKGQFLIPADRPRASTSRRPSDNEQKKSPHHLSFSSLHTSSPGGVATLRDGQPAPESQSPVLPVSKTKGKKPMSSPTAEEATPQPPQPVSPRRASPVDARKVASPPGSPTGAELPANPPPRRPARRTVQDSKSAAGSAKGKGSTDTNIVPPISVLIVDDNPINQTILSTFMRRKKIKYDVAKNGEEAVQKWRSGGFHLILMDIQMPVMDGIQATKEIRRLESLCATAGFAPSTPQSDQSARTPSEAASTDSRASASPYRSSVIIVALTASSLQSDRVAALAAGCNDFLTKPVSLQWLNNKIIEWGSIKALQMWADLRPEVVKSISTEQTVQAQNIARRLHVPEGRVTPAHSPSRSSSQGRTDGPAEVQPPPAPPTLGINPAHVRSLLISDSPESTPSTGSTVNSLDHSSSKEPSNPMESVPVPGAPTCKT